jgi:tetratricopeptide (TPR) repeat protein
MTRSKTTRAVLLATVGACALVAGASVSAQTPPTESPAIRLDARGALPAPTTSLFADPAFRRQLEQSYIAETEIEPSITDSERKQILAILKLIGDGKRDDAMKQLLKDRNATSSAVFEFMIANLHFEDAMNPELDADAKAALLGKARPEYEAAVKKYPKFRRAWRNLAMIEVQESRWQPASEALSKVIELGGGDATMYGLLGFAYSNLDDNVAAESAYRMAILLDPKTEDWKMGLARSFFKQERFADVIAHTGRMLEQNRDRADLWLLQANAFIASGQPMRAAENYVIVDGMGRSTADSLNMLADIYVNEGAYDLAVEAYGRALEKDAGTKPDRAVRAAKVLIARGAMKETKAMIAKLDALRGDVLAENDKKELLKLRARIAVAEGAGDEEARILEEIVRIDPLDGEALILLGQYYARTGENEKAIFQFERAASMEKFEADAKVRHAQVLVNTGRYAEALPLLRSAQQVKPRDSIQAYLDQVERVAARSRG